MEVYKEEKGRLKDAQVREKKEVNEEVEGKINEDIQGNRKLVWKEVRTLKQESKGNVQRIMNRDET